LNNAVLQASNSGCLKQKSAPSWVSGFSDFVLVDEIRNKLEELKFQI
jgi:hypothetical protein